MADGYARSTGKVGVVIATSGPGATNLVTGLATANMDSVPLVAFTGQVRSCADRQRRLPGGRHHRHHPPDHQAQLPGQAGRGPGPDDQGGVLHRPHGPARAGAGRPRRRRHARPSCAEEPSLEMDLPGYKPTTAGHIRADQGRRRGDQRRRAARAVRRRRGDHRRRLPRSCARWPRRATSPSPPRCWDWAAFDERRPAGAPDAGHARLGRRQLRRPGVRLPDRRRGAVRRPRHRQPGDLRPARQDHPHRHRPGSISKNVVVDIPVVGDAKDILGKMLPLHPGQDRAAVAGQDRRVEGALPAAVRHRRARSSRRRSSTRLGELTEARRDHRHRRRPAPDVDGPVLRLAQAAAVHHLRRAGHDGLRLPGGHRGAVRQPRRAPSSTSTATAASA